MTVRSKPRTWARWRRYAVQIILVSAGDTVSLLTAAPLSLDRTASWGAYANRCCCGPPVRAALLCSDGGRARRQTAPASRSSFGRLLQAAVGTYNGAIPRPRGVHAPSAPTGRVDGKKEEAPGADGKHTPSARSFCQGSPRSARRSEAALTALASVLIWGCRLRRHVARSRLHQRHAAWVAGQQAPGALPLATAGHG